MGERAVPDVVQAKALVRAAALARRDALPMDMRVEAALALPERLLPVLAVEPGTVVSGFLPIRSEIDLRPLMAALAERGAQLCLPAIADGRLEFRRLLRGGELEPQGFGTYAPLQSAGVVDPQAMLVPMAAFDRAGRRCGYGRGFYDRAIADLMARGLAPRLFGVAFAVQEVPEVPVGPHDIPLPLIATEREVLRP